MLMKIVMTPVGSAGDVHPFIGIGRALVARGHEVVIMAAAPFRAAAERGGIRFVEALSTEEYDRVSAHPDLWHPRRGPRFVLGEVARSLESAYDLIAREYEPGRTLLIGHTLSFATRTFEESHNAPAVTIHLAPTGLRSVHTIPAEDPARDLSRWPVWLKRAVWWVIDRTLIDPPIVPTLNRWRQEKGLPPVSRVFNGWLNSPQGVVALFPEWFGPRQPDWPANVQHAGFPRYDEADNVKLRPDLHEWVNAGDPPIVCTPGSAHREARDFFAAAADAARIVNRRALLLTRYGEQIPTSLPAGVRYEPYVPFSLLLPHSAALVHHGGIGTCAQGLGAGIPQLTMPMGFDQPDNTARLMRLGVAGCVLPRDFSGARVAGELKRLLNDDAVARACRKWAQRMHEGDPVAAACEAIERAGMTKVVRQA